MARVTGYTPDTSQLRDCNVTLNSTTGRTALCVDTELTDVTLNATSVAVNLARFSTILPTHTVDSVVPLQVNSKGMSIIASNDTTFPVIVFATTLANASGNPIYVSDVGGAGTSVEYINDTTTSVAATATFAQAVTSIQVNNIGTQTMWVAIGTTAVADQHTPVEPNVTYDEDRISSIGTSAVSVISNTTGTTWTIAGFY